jgi:hypothetical protein
MTRLVAANALLAVMLSTARAEVAMTFSPAQAEHPELKMIACVIGQAAIALHLQRPSDRDPKTAATVAQRYAEKRCKVRRLSDFASEYVEHSIHGIAKEWYR